MLCFHRHRTEGVAQYGCSQRSSPPHQTLLVSASNLFSQFINSVNLSVTHLIPRLSLKVSFSEVLWQDREKKKRKRKRKLKNILGIYQSRLQKSQELLLLRLPRAAAIRLYLEPMTVQLHMRVTEGHRFVQENKKQKTQASERTKLGGLSSQEQILFERAEWAPYQKSQSSDTAPSPLPSHHEKLTAKCPGIFSGCLWKWQKQGPGTHLSDLEPSRQWSKSSSQGLKPTSRFIFATTFSGKKIHLCPIWGN